VNINSQVKILVAFLCICFSIPLLAEEVFDESTGELHWDINSEVRLKYIPSCRIDGPLDSVNNSNLHHLIKSIDIFSVFDYYDNERYVICKGRGLRAIYRLREDGLFPKPYSKNISINGENIEYTYQGFSILKDSDDSENYQKIFSASQTKSTVTAKILPKNTYSIEGESTITGQLINISNIDESDAIQNSQLQQLVINLNKEIRTKYKFVIMLALALVFAILAMLLLYKFKVHPVVKAVSAIAFTRIKNVFHPLRKNGGTTNIIKKDSLKSYSVADELLKWAKLRDEGHISKAEFDAARKKILGDE